MALTYRENYLRNARFQGPEYIPMSLAISGASWDQLREDLEDVLARHPWMFPNFRKGQRDYDHYDFGPGHRAGQRVRDPWGVVWATPVNGLASVAVEHPLADIRALDRYSPPTGLDGVFRTPYDWDRALENLRRAKREGRLVSGGLDHGFLFLRLSYIRGFEGLMLDMAEDAPHLPRLIEMCNAPNRAAVAEYLKIGLDVLNLGEDLGTQTNSIISPAMFRKWIAPGYRELMEPCQRAGTLIALHSDGYILNLMDEFAALGVDIVNPQDLCNGIDNLVREVKGRFCIRLDVDRQFIVPYGTRADIRALIEEEVRKLGSPQGGLEFICGIYPPTPAENVDAVLEAMRDFRTYWWD